MNSTPENPCPQCGGTSGKRWRSYSGVELCSDCEWDYLCELNGRKLLDARRLAQDTSIPRASKSPRVASIRHNPGSVQHLTTRNLRASRWGGPDALGTKVSTSQPQPADNWRCRPYKLTLANVVTPGYNSLCLVCSHIFYGAALSSCSRCGGLCVQRSDHDLDLMGRHAMQAVEAEK